MAKLTLNDLATLSNEQSAINLINQNSDRIETAMEKTLSRDGTAPNQMQVVLDMNNNRIINLPEPEFDSDPVRLADVNTLIATATGGVAQALVDEVRTAATEVLQAANEVSVAVADLEVISGETAILVVEAREIMEQVEQDLETLADTIELVSALLDPVNPNKVLAGPVSGSDAVPAFRYLVADDLPNPTTTTKGGIKSIASSSNKFLTHIQNDGTPVQGQPNFSDLSGTLNGSQLPNPGPASKGGVISSSAVSNQFVTGLDTNGALTRAQPAFSNLSGSATTGQLPDAATLTAYANTFTSSLKGLAPSSGGGTTNFLRADGNWAAPPGSGGSQFRVVTSTGGTDTTAVQNALNAGVGTVWLPSAAYTLGAISIPTGVTLRGMGPAGTVITPTGSPTSLFTLTGARAQIMDLAITSGASRGVTVNSGDDCMVSRLNIDGPGRSIYVTGGSYFTRIFDCRLQNAGTAGIYLDGSAGGTDIRNVNAGNCVTGLYSNGAYATYVADSEFLMGTTGVYVRSNPSPGSIFATNVRADSPTGNAWDIRNCSNVYLNNCWGSGGTTSAGGYAYYIETVSEVNITGCQGINGYTCGLFFNQVTGGTITGGEYAGNNFGNVGAFGNGINIYASTNIAITGTFCGQRSGGSTNQRYGINVDTTGSNARIIVLGNACYGNAVAGIEPVSTSGTIVIGTNVV